VLSSLFTFVARNTRTDKSVLINRLKPTTSQELALFNQREETAMLRKKKLLLPQTSEIDEKHFKTLMERGQAFEDMPSLSDNNSILMRKTQLENIFICQPQNVNTAGRIF
jgi:acyl-coenzyme A thioesterase 9